MGIHTWYLRCVAVKMVQVKQMRAYCGKKCLVAQVLNRNSNRKRKKREEIGGGGGG